MAELQDFQQGSHCHRKTWINILLGILQLLLPCVQHGGAQLQALSQMSTSVVEVWQPEDADPLVPLQMEKDRRKDGLPLDDSSSPYTQENGRALQFQPPALDFGMQPLWLARAETIYIHNPSQEVPVMLLSMFTSSRQFYIPFFHRRVIEPKGKASFKLIFLPSEEDNIENTLFINTSSHGLLSYQVFGIGVHQGSLKSVQRKDSLLIFPHIHSIKLTQTQEDTTNITILGLLLEGSLPKSLFNNHQGSCLQSEEHISLQINLSARSDRLADLDKLKPYIIEHILVLLMAPAAGQASVGEQKIGVYMLNSGSKKLYVKDMQVLSKVEASLKFNQILLQPEAKNFTEVAALGCRGSFPGHGGKCINHISLKILGNWTTHGFPGLHITEKRTEMDLLSPFQVKQTDEDKVDVWMTNSLVLPLTVMNFSLSQTLQGVMKVVNFSSPFIVSQGCWLILSLQLLSRALPINQLSTLSLETSLGTAFKIPLYFQSTLFKHGDVVFEAERECGRPCSLRLSETGRSEWQRSLLPDFFKSSWPVDSKLAAEICSRWQSHKDKLPCRWPRLPIEASLPLDFGATPVNESKVKTFILKNPSATVVSIEIRVLSLYPAPLEALDLLTKWFNISPLSVNISTKEFSLLASPNQPDENLEDLTRKGVLRLLLQPWESREVAVVFTPSDDTPTTTILIIRNNLTVFDMKVVEGHGAKELLRVGGKLPGPGGSLRFNVPQSTLMECRDGLRTNKPLFPIRKSFKVENAGELPLTVMSMNINGYKCQGFGFEVLQCRSFSLDHNTSSEITIAFTPDFTSSWVIRDLTLVTSRGTSFPFTLNVTLPHHMLPLCAQVVPGPSWEETFWVITLIFTCFSLFGVCLMAFHQAQYILNEFSTPLRSHHNSVLSRDNGPVNNITPNGVNKSKGSCKSYVDTCHTSDKGKGRGSPALANNSGPRPQSSKKNSSVTPQQTQKKHKVSLYYTKYKSSLSTAPSGSVAVDEENEDLTPDPTFTSDSDVCNNNKPDLISELDKKTSANFKEGPHSCIEDGVPATVMFPMEISSGFPDNVTLSPGPRPGLLVCSPIEKVCIERYEEKMDLDKRDCLDLELREDGKGQKKKAQSAETGTFSGNNRGKRSRRKTDGSALEHKVVVMPEREKEPDWKTGDRNISGTRNRNRCCNGTKLESPKPGQSAESPLKQYGVCPARTRRKCITDRRGGGLCESGSDSGSSSGSVRTSRGSWGSWSSASSMEGDRDPSSRAHACTTSSRKREPVQYSIYPVERDCYQTTNTNYKVSSVNSLYHKDQCQSPDPPVSCFAPSFAAVAAGVDRNVDKDIQNVTGQYLPEETWSAPSIPLTNEFRYNTTEALPYIPQPATTASYNGFTWSSANSQCNSPYVYADQGNYIGNGTFPSGFPCQEGQPAHGSQTSWSEEQPQESPLTWDTAACVGSKPYFSGTRSLSPMSSLFGSIWTPQSEPYRSHFQPERSAPMSPVSPITPPCSPFSREAEGRCAPIQYSSFHPFGPHMNLDIWNSSSNRSSNSQLSNDSGYCGDV